MEKLLIVFVASYLLFTAWFIARNNKVSEFRHFINQLSTNYSKKHVGHSGHVLFYDKIPTYSQMLWSFKPLKLSSYFTPYEIEQMLSQN